MNKLLLVSATTPEIEPVLNFLGDFKTDKVNRFKLGGLQVDVLITGVGMVQTAFELGKKVNQEFDFVIHAGVAGSFHKFSNGEVVIVARDRFSEFGAEDDKVFLSIDHLELGMQEVEIEQPLNLNCFKDLPRVKGITVNTVHGNKTSIAKAVKRYDPDIETMESASFLLAASEFGWMAAEVRGISNQVEKRNKGAWELKLAIKNLSAVLIAAIKELSV